MLNKSELVSVLKGLKHEIGPEFTLGFGGVLVLNGIRDFTNDVDIDVPRHVFDELGKKHKVKVLAIDDLEIKIIEYSYIVDIHLPLKGCRREYSHKYKVWCLTLDFILEKKLEWNRPKDQADIAALKKILMV